MQHVSDNGEHIWLAAVASSALCYHPNPGAIVEDRDWIQMPISRTANQLKALIVRNTGVYIEDNIGPLLPKALKLIRIADTDK